MTRICSVLNNHRRSQINELCKELVNLLDNSTAAQYEKDLSSQHDQNKNITTNIISDIYYATVKNEGTHLPESIYKTINGIINLWASQNSTDLDAIPNAQTFYDFLIQTLSNPIIENNNNRSLIFSNFTNFEAYSAAEMLAEDIDNGMISYIRKKATEIGSTIENELKELDRLINKRKLGREHLKEVANKTKPIIDDIGLLKQAKTLIHDIVDLITKGVKSVDFSDTKLIKQYQKKLAKLNKAIKKFDLETDENLNDFTKYNNLLFEIEKKIKEKGENLYKTRKEILANIRYSENERPGQISSLQNKKEKLLDLYQNFYSPLKYGDFYKTIAYYLTHFFNEDFNNIISDIRESIKKQLGRYEVEYEFYSNKENFNENKLEEIQKGINLQYKRLITLNALLPLAIKQLNKTFGANFSLEFNDSLSDKLFSININNENINLKLNKSKEEIIETDEGIRVIKNDIEDTSIRNSGVEGVDDELNDSEDDEERYNQFEALFTIKQEEIDPLRRLSDRIKSILSRIPDGENAFKLKKRYDANDIYKELLYYASILIDSPSSFAYRDETGLWQFPFFDAIQKQCPYVDYIEMNLMLNPSEIAEMYTSLRQDFYQYVSLSEKGVVGKINFQMLDTVGIHVADNMLDNDMLIFDEDGFITNETQSKIDELIKKIYTIQKGILNKLNNKTNIPSDKFRDTLHDNLIPAIVELYKYYGLEIIQDELLKFITTYKNKHLGNQYFDNNDEIDPLKKNFKSNINIIIKPFELLAKNGTIKFNINNRYTDEFLFPFRNIDSIINKKDIEIHSDLVFKFNNKIYASYYPPSVLSKLKKSFSNYENAEKYFEKMKKITSIYDSNKDRFENYILQKLYEKFKNTKGNTFEGAFDFVLMNAGKTVLSTPKTNKGESYVGHLDLSSDEIEAIQIMMFVNDYIATPVLSESKKTAYIKINGLFEQNISKILNDSKDKRDNEIKISGEVLNGIFDIFLLECERIIENKNINTVIAADKNKERFVYLPFLNDTSVKISSELLSRTFSEDERTKITEGINSATKDNGVIEYTFPDVITAYERIKNVKPELLVDIFMQIIKDGIEKQAEKEYQKFLNNPHIIFSLLANRNDIILNERYAEKEEGGNKYSSDKEYEEAINELLEKYKIDGNLSNVVLTDEQKNRLKVFTYEYFARYFLVQSNIQYITGGDLAYYGNVDEYFKRAKQQTQCGRNFFTNSEYGKKEQLSIYIKDRIKASKSYKEVEEIFRKELENNHFTQEEIETILSNWRKIKFTDGQAMRTIDSWRSILDMQGLWVKSIMDPIYLRIKNGTATMDDCKIILNTIKPFLFSTEIVNGRMIPVIHKDAEMLMASSLEQISGILSQNKVNKALEKFMMEYGIDIALYESSVKEGAFNSIEINYSAKKIRELLKNLSSLNKQLSTLLNAHDELTNIDDNELVSAFINKLEELLVKGKDHRGISQEEYNQLLENVEPTEEEIRQILYDACIIKEKNGDESINLEVVHSHPYEDKMQVAYPSNHWRDEDVTDSSQTRNIIISDIDDNAEFDIGGKHFDKKQLIKLYYSLYIMKVIKGFRNRAKKFLGTNLTSLLIHLINKNPSYDKDLLNAVLPSGANTTTLPLSHPVIRDKIVQLMLTEFNTLSSLKTTGGTLALFCDTSGTLKIRMKDGSFFDKSSNKPIKADDILGLECYVPIMYKQLLDKYLIEKRDANGNVIYEIDNETIQKECPELLQLFMTRIPTEGKYSMLPMIIKGFSPEITGAGIVVPGDIVLITGADYDGDKGFIQYYNMYIGEDGKPHKVQYNYDKSVTKQSLEAIDNALLDIKLAIIKSKSIIGEVLRPGHFSDIEKLSAINVILNDKELLNKVTKSLNTNKENNISPYEVIKYLYNLPQEELDKYSQDRIDLPFTPSNNARVKSLFSEGIKDIGTFAVNRTAFAKLQQAELELEENYQFKFMGETIVKLCPIRDMNNKLTSDKPAQASAAAVDNGKNPRLANMGINKNNINIFNFLNVTEIPIVATYLLTNLYNLISPLTTHNLKDTVLSYNNNYNTNIKHTFKLKEFNFTTAMLAWHLNNINSEYNIEENASGFTKNFPKENLNDRLIERIYLRLLMQNLKTCASDWSQIALNTRHDNANGLKSQSLFDVMKKINAQKEKIKSIKGGNITQLNLVSNEDTDKKMLETFLGTKAPIDQACFSLGIELAHDLIKNYIPTESEAVNIIKEQLDTILDGRLPNNIDDQIITFLISSYFINKFNKEGEENIRDYFLFEFPKQFLQEIREKQKEDIEKYLKEREEKTGEKDNTKVSELITPMNIFTRSLSLEKFDLVSSARGYDRTRSQLSLESLLLSNDENERKQALNILAYAYFKSNLNPNLRNSLAKFFNVSFLAGLDDLNEILQTAPSTEMLEGFIAQFCQQEMNQSLVANKKSIKQGEIYFKENEKKITEKEIRLPNKIGDTTNELKIIAYAGRYYKYTSNDENTDERVYEVIETLPNTKTSNYYDATTGDFIKVNSSNKNEMIENTEESPYDDVNNSVEDDLDEIITQQKNEYENSLNTTSDENSESYGHEDMEKTLEEEGEEQLCK